MEFDDLFQAQRQLSGKDLIIYNTELHKNFKSDGIAYFLLIFFGGLGLHKFYLGRIAEGIVYFFVGTLDLISLQVIIFNSDAYWEPSKFVYFLFGFSAYVLLFDLFTLSAQISAQEKILRRDLLAKFGVTINMNNNRNKNSASLNSNSSVSLDNTDRTECDNALNRNKDDIKLNEPHMMYSDEHTIKSLVMSFKKYYSKNF